MISDRYKLSYSPESATALLDISEHFAACYGFEAKERLMIRLLTEEMISAVRSGLSICGGELWFACKDGMFSVTVSVSTDISTMPGAKRRQLLKLDNTPKKGGLFGLVREYMESLVDAEDELTMQAYLGSQYGEHMSAMAGGNEDGIWYLDMTGASWYLPGISSKKRESKEDPNEGIDIEKSLLQGFADDIRCTAKRGRLDMTVMKKIPVTFAFNNIVVEA